MAASNPMVYEQLLQMGIDEPIVQEASRRFQDIERAVNWAFDHGQTWLSDNNAASAGGFVTGTPEPDLLGKGPPQQQTHNNSPNVSPLLAAQSGSAMDMEDLRDVDMGGLSNAPSGPENPPPSPSAQDSGKKSRASFGKTNVNALGLQSHRTPGTTHRQLPPPPSLDTVGIDGESEEDQIQRAIRMSLGQDDGPFTTVPLASRSTQHVENAPTVNPKPTEAMDFDPPSYSDSSDANRRLRASAPPPEFTAEDKTSEIQLGSNNPFRPTSGTSAEKSVTFSRVPDTAIDHGNSSLVPVALGVDSAFTSSQTTARALTAQEQEDADLQAALNASLTENQAGGFPGTTSAVSTAGGTGGMMEVADELDLDPEGKALFDEGQRDVPLKQEGAPIAISTLWDNGLYAANIIQCLMATPQFRAAVASVEITPVSESSRNERLQALVNLSRFIQNSSNAYVTTLLGMNTLFDVAPSSDVSRAAAVFLNQVVEAWLQTGKLHDPTETSMTQSSLKEGFNPLFVSHTTLLNSTETDMNAVSSYTLNYGPSSGNSITDCIAAELWSETPNRFFASLGDILPIVVTRGAKNVWGETKPLVFEQDLYMDRFLAQNSSKVAQIRGNEGLSRKKIENLQEQLQKWTTHKNTDISATLDRTLKHFERKAEETSDQMIKDEVQTIIEKLKEAGNSITTQKEGLRQELELERQKSKDCWYQPDMDKERYTLRGVCFYAGWIARTSMYCYVRDESDAWWKISDTTVEPATFEQIQEDRTGLYFDSGAYVLVYARQTSISDSSETQEAPVQMDTDMNQPSESPTTSLSADTTSSLQITLT